MTNTPKDVELRIIWTARLRSIIDPESATNTVPQHAMTAGAG
jgi:hypothetical protein